MQEEYEDIKCHACGQVRGKRKVIRLSEDDKAQFAALETKIKGSNSLQMGSATSWCLFASLLPILIIIAVSFYDISVVNAWPADKTLWVLGPYYALWVVAYIWTSHREFKKGQARTQTLFRQEKEILTKYEVGDKDDYVIRQ